jgi:Helix-turn-helix domain
VVNITEATDHGRPQIGPGLWNGSAPVGMPRGAARIVELRQAGEQIITRPCQLHQHATHQVVYEMADKDQMSFSW